MRALCLLQTGELRINPGLGVGIINARKKTFSYSEKQSQSNDILLHFVEFSNVYNSDTVEPPYNGHL